MSWQKIENAFFVEKDGKYQRIDIGVCGNCGGIHIPAGKAGSCDVELIMTYEEIVEFYNKVHEDLKKKMLDKRKGAKKEAKYKCSACGKEDYFPYGNEDLCDDCIPKKKEAKGEK